MSRLSDAIGNNRAAFIENDVQLEQFLNWMLEKTDCSIDDLGDYLVKIDMGKVQKCWYSPEFVAKTNLEYDFARSRLLDLADKYMDFVTDGMYIPLRS